VSGGPILLLISGKVTRNAGRHIAMKPTTNGHSTTTTKSIFTKFSVPAELQILR